MLQQAHIWKFAPFARLLPPLVAGTCCADQSAISACWFLPCLLIFSFVLLLLHGRQPAATRYRYRWITGIALNGLLTASAFWLTWLNDERQRNDWFGHQLPSAAVSGIPAHIPLPGKKSARFTLLCRYIYTKDGRRIKVSGSLLVYLPAGVAGTIEPGSTVLIRSNSIRNIIAADNPGSFDFASYCYRNQLYHQVYIQPSYIQQIRAAPLFNLRRIVAAGQRSAMQSVRRSMPVESHGIAFALLIGYRQELDKSLLQAYTNTGVVHVIAVSGMHLGLIFLLLQHLLLLPGMRYNFASWLKAILVLLVIWWFSCVAGSAASIVRAAVMFTYAMIGRLIRKPCHNLHGLFLCAFLLLVIKPYWLWDAGFQLSFAALSGIMLFQPVLDKLFTPANRSLLAVWQLCAVTCAAQLLTFPISIYHFHQAPIYFLGANLWAVPISSLALVTALVQWLICAAGLSFYWAGDLTHRLILLMNQGIRHFSSLPFSVIEEIEWGIPEVILAYLAIALIPVWLANRSAWAIPLLLFQLTVWSGFRCSERILERRRQELVVFHLPGNTAALMVSGVNGLLHLASLKTAAHPAIAGASRHYGVAVNDQRSARYYRLGDTGFAVAGDSTEVGALCSLQPEYLLLTGSIKRLNYDLIPPQNKILFIIDGSVPEWKAALWESALTGCGYRVHNTWKSGAFLTSWKKSQRND